MLEYKKVVIVTGASSGIGYQTCKLIDKNKYIVYGTTRKKDNFNKLKEVGVNPYQLNLLKSKEIDKMIKFIYQKHGRIDILVNNAGFGDYAPLELVPIKDFQYQLDINVISVLNLIKQVIPIMRKQQRGKIINIGSIAGKFSMFFGGCYHTSKYCIEAISESLYLELKQFDINVSCVEPGVIKTPWVDIAMDHLDQYKHNEKYRDLIFKTKYLFKKLYNSRFGTNPIKVANKINYIINCSNPRLKYAVGFGSHEITLLKKVLPDNAFYPLLYRIVDNI